MATTKKSTINFAAKNVKSFTAWLKRFSSIDNSLLLEIDLQTEQFIAKSYNEERSVVKMSSIKFDEAGLVAKITDKDPKRIKAGLFNILRLIKIIDQFNDVEFTIAVEWQPIVSDNNTEYVAEKLLLNNKLLKMNVDCTSLNIFKYISDDLFRDSIASTDAIGTFELTKTNIEKVNSLCTLDNEYKFIKIKFFKNKVYASGKTFEYLVDEAKKLEDSSLNIFKDQYTNLDVENYIVTLGDDRLVFVSNDSNTTCVISETTDTE